MTTDRQALQDALKAVSFHDRANVTKDALDAALAALPEDQAESVRQFARQLSDQLSRLGTGTALEVLAAIGMLWSENGDER